MFFSDLELEGGGGGGGGGGNSSENDQSIGHFQSFFLISPEQTLKLIR